MDKNINSVDDFLKKPSPWQKEFALLRQILLKAPLKEEFKWKAPCYTFEGKNIVLMEGFKEYCALILFKGALLKDPKGILKKPGEQTQSTRLIHFKNAGEIKALKSTIESYLAESIAAQKAGLKVKLKSIEEYAVPEEFQKRLKSNAALKAAFHALTPGRQRNYLYFFASAMQSQTRESRIEKCIPLILKGQGLND